MSSMRVVMVVKRCIVKGCQNNSENMPCKIFIGVPRDSNRRQKWFDVLGYDSSKGFHKHDLYCCEDHFDVSHTIIM